MPDPTQTRKERIHELVETFRGLTNVRIEAIIDFATERFPTVRRRTTRDYAEVTFRILNNKALIKIYDREAKP